MVNQFSAPTASDMFATQPGTSASVAVDESLSLKSELMPRAVRRGLSKAEGPIHNEKGFLYELQQGMSNQSLGASVFGSGQELPTDLSVPLELTAADISLSTLYLHELHHRQVYSTRPIAQANSMGTWKQG